METVKEVIKTLFRSDAFRLCVLVAGLFGLAVLILPPDNRHLVAQKDVKIVDRKFELPVDCDKVISVSKDHAYYMLTYTTKDGVIKTLDYTLDPGRAIRRDNITWTKTSK